MGAEDGEQRMPKRCMGKRSAQMRPSCGGWKSHGLLAFASHTYSLNIHVPVRVSVHTNRTSISNGSSARAHASMLRLPTSTIIPGAHPSTGRGFRRNTLLLVCFLHASPVHVCMHTVPTSFSLLVAQCAHMHPCTWTSTNITDAHSTTARFL